MATLSIPQVTLPVGAREIGPAPIADADSQIALTIDRTVPGGLNATPAARIDLAAEVSVDAGATWTLAVGGLVPGGEFIFPPPRGDGVTPGPVSQLTVNLTQFPGTGRRIKATLAVSGAPVTVAGTLTTS